MWELISIGKRRKLTNEEKKELQVLFLRVAANDARVQQSEEETMAVGDKEIWRRWREYRQRQRDYEADQWRNAGAEERECRIQMRKQYLFAAYHDRQDIAREVLECPNLRARDKIQGFAVVELVSLSKLRPCLRRGTTIHI